ncbi:large ribosomal subunit protein mL49 [Linepithema humile]|uniref:large ribosomal subunit protein mL49 n=1 Tax=Linepithema humile TaxID=83485 RepID=UPI0006232EE5|nr:PREDICTED: probable 39S ribosomal protein L49, mitochondrial [Linepithema humile]
MWRGLGTRYRPRCESSWSLGSEREDAPVSGSSRMVRINGGRRPLFTEVPKMAALRIFARSSLAAILNPARPLNSVTTSRVASVAQIQQRWSSFKSSPIYEGSENYTDYEITNDPKEWEYVERLLRYKTIPKPPTGDVQLSSGYKPARAVSTDYSYFIERTKNYMQPVYLRITHRGTKRYTKIGKIQGDIWALERDLKKYLEERTGVKTASQIHEFAGILKIKGDYVNRVKEWMDTKGF